MSAEAPGQLLGSPCIGVCHLDAASGWCTGCGRDLAEIGHWRDLGAGERAEIWQHLAARLERMGQAWVLQPWPPATVHARVTTILARGSARLLVRGDGGWTTGRLPAALHPAVRVFKGRDGLALAMPRGRLADADVGIEIGLLPTLPESYRAIALVLTSEDRGACLPESAR
jgi:predicted Fe-S protein YdhL (DUF1289 family)